MSPANATMIREQINYINIGYAQETLFNWRSDKGGTNLSQIDVTYARNYPKGFQQYVHLKKQGYKIVFRKFQLEDRPLEKITFLISGVEDCQYQVLEALIEFLAKEWFDAYANVLSDMSFDGRFFDAFREIVESCFTEVPANYVTKVRAKCRLCDEYYDIYVRNSLIEQSTSNSISLVFEHSDHALLLYIDKQFNVRGENVVEITG